MADSGRERHSPTRAPVVITGLAAVSACGRGTAPLLQRTAQGDATFGPVTRFDTSRYRVDVAAELPGSPDLLGELASVVDEACDQAKLSGRERADTSLLLATRVDPMVARLPSGARAGAGANTVAASVAERSGLAGATRAYTSACVAASSAVADAAAMISTGRAERLVVAAGYLVDEYHFALFDAGHALATDGVLRAFSTERRGTLLGDAVVAMVLEPVAAAASRGVPPLARVTGWGRGGDGHHVIQPHPRGTGLVKAVRAALRRADRAPADIGYVNAHGTGTVLSDAAEAAALRGALGEGAPEVPVSSSKSVHGHALEASGLLELAVTVLSLRSGCLPVNAGFLGPDEDCQLNVVAGPRRREFQHALTVNFAFGGANTALVVSAA